MKLTTAIQGFERLARDAADAVSRRIWNVVPAGREAGWMLGADAWPAPAPVRVTARTRGRR